MCRGARPLTDPTAHEVRSADPWLRRTPLLASLLVLVIGVVYSFALENTQRFADERDYLRISYYLYHDGIYSKDGVTPTAYRPPGYPVVLGAVQYWGRSIAIRLTNFVLLAATILVGSRFLVRRGLPRAAALAAVLTAVYPPFIYTAGTIYPQTLGGLLLAWFFLLLPLERRLGLGRGAALGLVGCAVTLTIPTFLPAIGLGFLWVLWHARGRALAGLVVAGLVLGAGIGAWGLRNQHALGKFVPLATNSGRNLLLGNSPGTTATSGVNVDLDEYDVLADPLDEVARDDLYRDAAVEWIRANPGAWLELYVLKVLNHFNVWNTYATDEELGYVESIVLAVFFVPLFALFLWRVVRIRSVPPFTAEGLLILVYFAMALVSAIFFTRIRFRLPLDHALIWVVAAFVAGDARRTAPGGDAQKSSR